MEMIMQYKIIESTYGTECATTSDPDTADLLAHALTDSPQVEGEYRVKEVAIPTKGSAQEDRRGFGFSDLNE